MSWGQSPRHVRCGQSATWRQARAALASAHAQDGLHDLAGLGVLRRLLDPVEVVVGHQPVAVPPAAEYALGGAIGT